MKGLWWLGKSYVERAMRAKSVCRFCRLANSNGFTNLPVPMACLAHWLCLRFRNKHQLLDLSDTYTGNPQAGLPLCIKLFRA